MTFSVVNSRALSGMDAPLVEVETHLANGLPQFNIVGLPDTEVKESRDRVRAAILQSGFAFPAQKITVNLAPADLPKESGRFDLPIAIGILAASGQVNPDDLARYEFAGELALSGSLRPIRGALAMAWQGQQAGRAFVLPEDNAEQVAMMPNIEAYGAGSLNAVAAHLNRLEPLPRAQSQQRQPENRNTLDLKDVKGQHTARLALEIAAAGGHSLLMVGPPGTGKSMLAQRLPTILPPLTADADIDTALESSSAKMVIDIPPAFGRDLLRGTRPEIGFYLDGAESFNASNLTGYIASILGDYARDQAHAHGIRLPPDAAQLVPRFRYNPDFKSILAIAPGVLMLALSLFPAMMAAVGVVREREIGSIANFYASPASRLQFLLGKQLPYLAAAMLSFLILYLMMRYWFGVPLNGSAAALLTGTLLMCATTTATGLLVSCFTRSQVAAIFITAVGTVMPAMSFSGFLVPVSSLQGGAYIMGKILPSAWYANLTTGTFVKGLGYPDLVREHFILGGYYLIILTLAVLNLKKQER